ncbi:hypothetical protein [Prochlorococcus marinus]|uniref:hypothetical protein n=1 Tax=Prochlorococcus marinus TaxID=1219 RepID=UPI0022B2EFC5|nr:hypothetical protein [Prochlorococcus marinus]
MNNQSLYFFRIIIWLFFFLVIPYYLTVYCGLKKNNFVIAGLKGPNTEKNIHSSFDDSNDSFFPTNPLELMNVIRSIESMNNATSPSDAIDDALKAFDEKGEEGLSNGAKKP